MALVSVLTPGFPFSAIETAVAERFSLAASSFAVIPIIYFSFIHWVVSLKLFQL